MCQGLPIFKCWQYYEGKQPPIKVIFSTQADCLFLRNKVHGATGLKNLRLAQKAERPHPNCEVSISIYIKIKAE